MAEPLSPLPADAALAGAISDDPADYELEPPSEQVARASSWPDQAGEGSRSPRPAVRPDIRQNDDDERGPLRFPTAAELFADAPAWLVSTIVHMLVMIALGLMAITHPIVDRFVLSLGPELEGEDLAPGEFDVPFGEDDELLDDAGSFEPQPIDAAETLAETTHLPAPVATQGAMSALSAEPIQMALEGRQAGMKDGLLRAYGGSAGTQLAVEEALKWLARNQDKTGLWNLDGPFSDGAGPNNRDAATALALIAFQGDGHTPAGPPNDPYTRLTGKAWKAFLARQDDDGNFFQEGGTHGRLYTQAMCTIALCELYGMTKDSIYRDQAQRAIDYCVKVQAKEGGWRYFPGEDSDLSVTGWFVMALQSGRMAGLEVPSETLEKVGRFLDRVSRDSGAQYGYVEGQGASLSMTAEGLLCRQYLGWSHDNGALQRGVGVLTSNLVSWSPPNGNRNAYYWYYASQVCHHMEGTSWRTWNAAVCRVLPEHQVRDGRERGSWDPAGDEWGMRGGGRLLVTCLHTFMLEVYYRHLPIYQLRSMATANGGRL